MQARPLAALTLLVVACSPFGTDSSAPSADAAAGPAVPGRPADYNLFLIAPPTPLTIVQGSAIKAKINLQRSQALRDARTKVALTLSPRSGFNASPRMIDPDVDDVEFEIGADPNAAQGAATVEVLATAGDLAQGRVSVGLFVRGPAGSVDTTFGKAGIAESVFSLGLARAVLVQSTNKVVVVADCKDPPVGPCVARLTADGALDLSFGTAGRTRLEHPLSTTNAAALQPDGKIIVATATNALTTFIVRRLTPEGLIDSGFGVAGIHKTVLPEGFGTPIGIAPSADGGMIVGFRWYRADNKYHWGLLYLSAAGVPIPPGSGFVYGSWTVGDALLTSVTSDSTGRLIGVGVDAAALGAGVFRLTPQHQYDPLFGTGGSGFYSVALGAQLAEIDTTYHRTLVLQPTGKLVTLFPRTKAWTLTRFDANGAGIDHSFADDGFRLPHVNGDPTDLAPSNDGSGRLLLLAFDGDDGTWTLSRLSAEGGFDQGFGVNGVAKVKLETSGSKSAEARALVQQTDGRIVVVGHSFPRSDITNRSVWVTRLWN